MSRRATALRALAVGLLLVCGTAVQAIAQPLTQEQRDSARAHFKAAVAAEQAKDFATAVKEYQAAYDITKDPKVLYFVAKSHDQAGHAAEAVTAYRRYLKEAEVSTEVRAEVEARLAVLTKATGTGTAGTGAGTTGTGAGAGTAGTGAGTAGTGAGTAGTGTGAGTAGTGTGAGTAGTGAGAGTAGTGTGAGTAGTGAGAGTAGTGTAGAGTAGTGEGEVGAGETGLGAAGTIPTPPPAEGPHWQRTAAWVSVGVAAAALAAGGVLASSALSREDEIDRLNTDTDTGTGLPLVYAGSTQTDYEDAEDEGHKFQTWATVAFVGAGVAGVAAATFFYLDARAERAHEAVPAPVPSAGAARITPFFAPTAAGVAARWEF